MSRQCLLYLSLATFFLLGSAPSESRGAIRIPVRFLEKENLLPRIVQARKVWLFDLYLVLLRGRGDLSEDWQEFSLDQLAKDTGISQRLNRSVYLRTVLQSLDTLQSEFHLVKMGPVKKETLPVQLLDFDDPGLPLSSPLTGYLELQDEYWSYHWNQKLSLTAKWVYLVELALEKLYPNQKEWRKSFRLIHERFHLSEEIFEKGLLELRRDRLVAVRYQVDPSLPGELQQTYYLLAIYDPQAVEQTLANLARQYGEARVKLVRNYARLLYAEYDPDTIQKLVLLYQRYGDYSFKKILTTVGEEPQDSPKRSLEYAITLLKQERW